MGLPDWLISLGGCTVAYPDWFSACCECTVAFVDWSDSQVGRQRGRETLGDWTAVEGGRTEAHSDWLKGRREALLRELASQDACRRGGTGRPSQRH